MTSSSNKLAECRKVRKPKIEKLRRARINSSLESLKEILLHNTISIPQGSRPTKLEKADILEMTVRYVEMLHDKLLSGKKSSKKSMETFGDIQWKPNHKRAFNDITNQMDKRQSQQTQIVDDNKRWFNNNQHHFHLHQESSNGSHDKENLTIEFRHGNQSMVLEEHHWRPW